MFAKMFDTHQGQIVVIKDTSSKGQPIIKTYAEPKGFGVCQSVLKFADSDEGWDKMEAAFDKIDENLALELAKDIFLGAGCFQPQ